ncbi:MAG: NTP transferase domain-containing protein [Clostridia bacterium]|nr:NTP transferase domain-containing protein [Clostridia bacterium]
MTGLILAAGKGSRLSSGTGDSLCKPLVPAAGKPLIAYSLDNIALMGLDRAVVVIRRSGAQIADALGTSYGKVRIEYVVQDEPTGLVSSILAGCAAVSDDVVLQLSDEIFISPNLSGSAPELFSQTDLAVGYTVDSEDKIKRNYSLELSADGRVLGCVEKPRTVTNDLKGTGFCYFSAPCIQLLRDCYDPEKNEPNDLCDLINMLIGCGKTALGFLVAEEEINVNTPDDLLYANRRLS